MRTAKLLLIAALAACHVRNPGHVTGGALGRVVIYRNGVAFYERNAAVTDGQLVVRVPRERVDDFLKSLTVVDVVSGKALAVTIPRRQDASGAFLTMTLSIPEARHGSVKLTYVTEAPAWKPSYRIVVGADKRVMLESWAIVDNTTSEDWNGVLVGVGTSSALAFRYDLWSVRSVDRDLLQGEQRFAVAPPTGVSPYVDTTAGEELATLSGDEVRTAPVTPSGPAVAAASSLHGTVTDKNNHKLAGVTVIVRGPDPAHEYSVITDAQGTYHLAVPPGDYRVTFAYDTTVNERTGVKVVDKRVATVNHKMGSNGEVIAIQGSAPIIEQGATRTGVTINNDYTRNIPVPVPGRTFESVLGAAAGEQMDQSGVSYSGSTSLENGYYVDGVNVTDSRFSTGRRPAPPKPSIDDKLRPIVTQALTSKRDLVVEVHGPTGSEPSAIARGNTMKNRLVDAGVPAARVRVVPKLGDGESDTVRVLAVAAGASAAKAPTPAEITDDTPVGEAHFLAERPMTIASGSSAMVSMLRRETAGGVVYLYDPLSERGHQQFAFKSVRLDNPTDDTLEAGPVTVYGDSKFVGEGITEAIPPRSAAVIPFALDKQVIVNRHGTEEDSIAQILTVQRGIVTAELQHRRDSKFTVTSRLTTPSVVYLRHKLEDGWTLVDSPSPPTKLGDSQLFAVELQPHETKHVTISQATPIERTFDLQSDEGLGMMKLYVNEPKASPELKARIEGLLAIYQDAADLVDKIDTLRDQLAEYRSRAGELNAQIVTLKAVRTSGPLMATLKSKLAEITEHTQRATIALVNTQEQLMLTRVKFANLASELRLGDARHAAKQPARARPTSPAKPVR